MAGDKDGDEGAGDVRVGWVYTLKKEDLALELRKYHLETGGNVNEMRARLVLFLRTGEGQITAPDPLEKPAQTTDGDKITTGGRQSALITPPAAMTLPPAAMALPPRAQVCDAVRKWGIRFDGNTDPISFLERIEELTKCYQFNPHDLLVALPELLKEKVLLWYRNNQGQWRTWGDFVKSFKSQYLPPRFHFWLEEEIRNRTQGQRESATEYVTSIQTLMRRHGKFSLQEQLERIYENLKPEYKLYIRRKDFLTLNELLLLAEEYEAVQSGATSFRPPPSPAQAYVFETAYNPRKSKVKDSYQASSPVGIIHESPAVSKNPQVREPSPHRNFSHNQPKNQTAPFRDSRTNNQSNSRTTQPNPQVNNNVYSRQDVCWRCGKRGHRRPQCRGPAKIFCSWCGREGILSRDCTCKRPGNGSRRPEN